VQVENGEVILEGTVDSRPSKRMAEETAETVSGVHDVHNRLRIEERDHDRDRMAGRSGK
jgi:osmotically-inducible protein OsmY